MNSITISKRIMDRLTICQWLFAGAVVVMLIGGRILKAAMTDSGMSGMLFLLLASVAVTVALVFLAQWLSFSGFAHKRPYICYLVLCVIVTLCAVVATLDGQRTDWAFLLLAAGYALAVYAERDNGVLGVVLSVVVCVPVIVVAKFTLSLAAVAVLLVSAAAVTLLACADGWFGCRRRALTVLALSLFVLLAAVILFMLLNEPFIRNRLYAGLFPYSDPEGLGYQTIITRELLGDIKLFGVAEGVRPEVMEYMLEGVFQNERLLTQVACCFGWGALAIVLAVFVLILVSGFVLSMKKQGLPRYIGFTVMVVLSMQGLLYAAQNLGFHLVTVWAMPFLPGGFWQNTTNLLLAATVLTFRRPIEEPLDQQYEDDYDSKAENTSLVHYLWCAIEVWLQAKDHPEGDKPSPSAPNRGGTSRLEIQQFSLPEATDIVKSRVCLEDSLLGLDEEDIDRLLSINSSCCLYTYSGGIDDLISCLKSLDIPDKDVMVQLIFHNEITLNEVERAGIAIAERCISDAYIRFGLALDKAMGESAICVVVLTAQI